MLDRHTRHSLCLAFTISLIRRQGDADMLTGFFAGNGLFKSGNHIVVAVQISDGFAAGIFIGAFDQLVLLVEQAEAVGVGGVVATAGISMFPFIVPSSRMGEASLTLWDSVSSELTLSIVTVAGLGTEEKPHLLQDAYSDLGAAQCGFCIPGMIVASAALLEENPSPTRDEIRQYLSGNICRCTGYQKAVDAVEFRLCVRIFTIVQGEDRTDQIAHAGGGLRIYATRRFVLRAEFKSYVVFTSRDDNEEVEEWKVGFAVFF